MPCLSFKNEKVEKFQHSTIYDVSGNDSGRLLIVIRDSLARMLSAFNYERPNATDPRAYKIDSVFESSKLYEECHFQTLEGE